MRLLSQENGAARKAVGTDDLMYDIAAATSLRDRFNLVPGERSSQHSFELQFENLALEVA